MYLTLLYMLYSNLLLLIVLVYVCTQGYFRRAEALKALLSSPILHEKVPQGKGFTDVVSDYCESNAIKPLTPSMLCEALVLAVDNSKLHVPLTGLYTV